MRVRRLAVLIASLTILWAVAVDARAAPAGGGSYEGDVLLKQPCRDCLSLVVANDGLSLEEGYVAFDAPCVVVQFSLPATTLVDAEGAFAWADDQVGYQSAISGRFTSDGLVHGTISFTGGPGRGCSVRDVPFRARLTGLPARTRAGIATTCGAVPGRGTDVVAHERGTGCTRAKLLAVAWALDPACARAVDWPACELTGFRCAGTRGGRSSPQASVRCVTSEPRFGTVEFEAQTDCGYLHNARLNLTAVNASCRAARRVGNAMPEGCGERIGDRCGARDYRCRVTGFSPDSTFGRCVKRNDPFYAVVFEYVLPL